MTRNMPIRYQNSGQKMSGGMGEVYLFKDTNLDRTVAIKYIRDVNDMHRLMDEISALQRLRSRYVVQIYDIVMGDERGEIGIVQEFIPGNDLARHNMSSGAQETLKTMYQVASGLSDIHAQGIIHRDLKPNNLKLDSEGILKIFDFGLARPVDGKAHTFGFKGTFGFAAPELLTGGTTFFTQAVDVYALGAIAWWLSDGDLPAALKENPPQSSNPVPSIGTAKITLPSEVVSIIDKCLSVNPTSRPTASDVCRCLAKHLLHGKHRGLATFNGTTHSLSKVGQHIDLNSKTLGGLRIKYDGFEFICENVTGSVFVNAKPLVNRSKLPGSCVITLGGPEKGRDRIYVTFDISHPEVMA